MNNLPTIRIDKNFAFNILDFRKIEDAQTQSIVKSLLLYFSHQYEKDLFGYGKLDPVEFARVFNFNRTNLSRKIEKSEEQNKLKSFEDWNTYLENALYILASTPVYEEYRGEDENYNIVGFKNYICLKEVFRYTPKKANSGKLKKYYKYSLDKSFETNLKKFFLNVNLNFYLQTKKWNGEDFYLQIMNIYNQSKKNGTTSFYWDINTLISYFNVSHKEIRIQKIKLTTIFNKYEALLQEEIKGLSFVWQKTGNQKYAYTLFMMWEKTDKTQLDKEKIIVLSQLFLDTLKRYLYLKFNFDNLFIKENIVEFYNWLIDKQNKTIVIETYKLVSNELNGKSNFGVDRRAVDFYDKIKIIRDIKLMDKCFVAEVK